MGWRFRKSFIPLPGVRVTLSPRGVSTSVGVGPLRATIGTQGASVTAHIPGTGLSYRNGIDDFEDTPQGNIPAVVPNQPNGPGTGRILPEMADIKSAGSNVLTTEGLSAFKQVLSEARHEHEVIVGDLRRARSDESAATEHYERWKNGLLMRRLFKGKFENLRLASEELTAKRAELEEQERLSHLQTQIEVPDCVAKAFHSLSDEFSSLSASACIWDTIGKRSTNRFVERTTAARVVDRKPVKFRIDRCELIEYELRIPHLENANGGDIFLYPAFILYFVSPTNFALLEYKDLMLRFDLNGFIEEEQIPKDSKVIGETWAKANKDGSPDRRFNNNYRIPVVQYGTISITSGTGMNEEYMVSNVARSQAFVSSWNSFVKAVASVH